MQVRGVGRVWAAAVPWRSEALSRPKLEEKISTGQWRIEMNRNMIMTSTLLGVGTFRKGHTRNVKVGGSGRVRWMISGGFSNVEYSALCSWQRKVGGRSQIFSAVSFHIYWSRLRCTIRIRVVLIESIFCWRPVRFIVSHQRSRVLDIM